jgi:ubiquinone/menaquinone biosynthesis C-methylase UbiE
MLERKLEPEVMDSDADAQEYNDMDHSEVNQLFVADLLTFAEENRDHADEELQLGDVLDLGTGTALIPVELCKQHSECRVMAVDMAASMLDLAVYNVAAAGLDERIQINQADAKQLGFQDQMFDVVISNSIIHHIPEPFECLQEMQRVTGVGGILFVRDLMRPQNRETLAQLVETYTGAESEYSQQLFADSLHAALSLEEIRGLVAQLGFDSNSVNATSDRHWTWAAIEH